MQLNLVQLTAVAVVSLTIPTGVWTADTKKVLGPSGEVLIAPSVNKLEQVESPQLAPAPGATPNEVQADCLTEEDIFYGSDFLSTEQRNASTAADCCAACKLANDCTVWNWCGNKDGCELPSNLATAGNRTVIPHEACLWKPRPLNFAGTLPLPPTSNSSTAMAGWTSGVPINASLLPALSGFELQTGIEMEYNSDVDFFCTGSSTSKPVCALYGNAKGGALACLNNPICRGFQVCWAFPTSADYYQETGIIRLKGGAEAPLNTSGALQNPYCSVYVLKAGAASAPNSGEGGYSLRSADNKTAVNQATENLISGSGRKLLQSSSTTNSPAQELTAASRGIQDQPQITNLVPTQAPTGSSGRSAAAPVTARAGTNFSTPYLQGTTLPAFPNTTFNYTQCYSDAPTIRATLQSQLFPLQGPTMVYSIHTWTEVPFRNSGDVCCAFQDQSDLFLNLETGVLAKTLPMTVATDPRLTTGPALKNYDTKPVSTVESLVYIPDNQMNSPGGQGRQYTFPRMNGSDYATGIEQLYFSLAQTALGNRFCTPGFPQLASAVNYVGQLLSLLSEDGVESLGGLPVDMQFITTTQTNPDGSLNNASCLIEQGAVYEGDVLKTLSSGNATVESCCEACWLYGDPTSDAQCDVWVLNSQDGSCELKNSTVAASFEAVPADRSASSSAFTSGRRTAVLPPSSPVVFTETGI